MILQLLVAAAETQPSGGAGTNTIIAVLGAGGFGAILAAVVTGLFSKRKLGAEATEIITNAAAGVVTSMQGQLARAESTRREDQDRHERQMSAMAQAHVKERNAWQQVLQLHAAWDHIAIAKLNDLGFTDLPAVPPLTPAERFVDDDGYPVDGVN